MIARKNEHTERIFEDQSSDLLKRLLGVFMINEIRNRTDWKDWVGCVPLVGTALGLVEMIYYMGIMILDECMGPKERKEIKSKFAESDCKRKLADQYTAAAKQTYQNAMDAGAESINNVTERYNI